MYATFAYAIIEHTFCKILLQMAEDLDNAKKFGRTRKILRTMVSDPHFITRRNFK